MQELGLHAVPGPLLQVILEHHHLLVARWHPPQKKRLLWNHTDIATKMRSQLQSLQKNISILSTVGVFLFFWATLSMAETHSQDLDQHPIQALGLPRHQPEKIPKSLRIWPWTVQARHSHLLPPALETQIFQPQPCILHYKDGVPAATDYRMVFQHLLVLNDKPHCIPNSI